VPHRGPYRIRGRNKSNTLLFPDPSSSSSSFFFTSHEILRQLYQRRSWMFSYSKQFTFYTLCLSFTFTVAEYADVVNVYGFLLWMLNTRAGFRIDKLGFDE
jgi:nitrate reductase NapE component